MEHNGTLHQDIETFKLYNGEWNLEKDMQSMPTDYTTNIKEESFGKTSFY